jgi:aspartyl-tRNA synthetase
MYRTHHCGELTISNKETLVTLAGWVKAQRKFGSITFIDLRDRYGITQLFFNESMNERLDAQPLGREFVLQIQGVVQ